MEFNEKLQELRKHKGLTQEELAARLFVSRTAVSKWESGRGYPNIDSLKAIAKFFGVTVDALLSGEELLTIAEEDTKEKENHIRSLVFGLLDAGTAMLFFLPFFGKKAGENIQAVPLLGLTAAAPYLRAAYFVFVAAGVLLGLLTLALQNCRRAWWLRYKHKLSMLFGTAGVLLFIVGQQPYAAVFLLIFLIIKALMLIQWP